MHSQCLDFDKAILRPILANAYCAVTVCYYIPRLAPYCILHKLSETRIVHGLFALRVTNFLSHGTMETVTKLNEAMGTSRP